MAKAKEPGLAAQLKAARSEIEGLRERAYEAEAQVRSQKDILASERQGKDSLAKDLADARVRIARLEADNRTLDRQLDNLREVIPPRFYESGHPSADIVAIRRMEKDLVTAEDGRKESQQKLAHAVDVIHKLRRALETGPVLVQVEAINAARDFTAPRADKSEEIPF